MLRRTTVLTAVACGAMVALGACTRGADRDADTMGGMMPGGDSATMAPPPASTTATPMMTDAQIVARVAAANQGEIAAGKIAQLKATNADVKAFARMMVTDHTKMLNDGNMLARRLNITPDTAAADSITNTSRMMADRLNSAAKGAAFDSAYVNGQVMMHESTLQMLRNAEGQAQHADLKKMLADAQKPVQQHLDRIKEIQGKMQ